MVLEVVENEFAELVPETTSFIVKTVIVNVILYLYSIIQAINM